MIFSGSNSLGSNRGGLCPMVPNDIASSDDDLLISLFLEKMMGAMMNFSLLQ
jgi:hypothetical protein